MTLRIYTEPTSDHGGIWAFKPFAMVHVCWVSELDYHQALDRAEAAEAHSATYRAQVDATLKDRALILAERDRTFALMLARAEAAEARVAELEAERDPDCTDCEGSGVTHQTERYCSCHAGRELAVYARAAAAEAENARLVDAIKDTVLFLDQMHTARMTGLGRDPVKYTSELSTHRDKLAAITTKEQTDE
jgi:hypothetical protein